MTLEELPPKMLTQSTTTKQTEQPQQVGAPMLSVVMAIDTEDVPVSLFTQIHSGLAALGVRYEVVCVYDARQPGLSTKIEGVAQQWPELKPIAQRPWAGEDAAVAVAINRVEGDSVLVLPGWFEIDAAELPKLYAARNDFDMVLADRSQRKLNSWQRFRANLLQGLISLLFGHRMNDVFSRVRLASRALFQEISSYGVRQHFMPLLALSKGYSVGEVPVKCAAQASTDAPYRFKPWAHISALLDIISLYVVLNFLQRPLRFFGAIGITLAAIGALITGWLVFERIFLAEALADRPLLIFSVLMIVLGVQIIAIGLIGEIVIFASNRSTKTYDIVKIVGRDGKPPLGTVAQGASVDEPSSPVPPDK